MRIEFGHATTWKRIVRDWPGGVPLVFFPGGLRALAGSVTRGSFCDIYHRPPGRRSVRTSQIQRPERNFHFFQTLTYKRR